MYWGGLGTPQDDVAAARLLQRNVVKLAQMPASAWRESRLRADLGTLAHIYSEEEGFRSGGSLSDNVTALMWYMLSDDINMDEYFGPGRPSVERRGEELSMSEGEIDEAIRRVEVCFNSDYVACD